MVELAIRWSQQLVSLALQVLAWAGLSSVTAAGQVLKFLRYIALIVSKNYAFVLSLLRLVVAGVLFQHDRPMREQYTNTRTMSLQQH